VSAAEQTAHGDEPAVEPSPETPEPETPEPETPEPETRTSDTPGADALASAVQELTDRIEALQADVRRLGGPGLPPTDPGWESEEPDLVAPSYAWVSSIPAPVRRRRAVPRLLLEVLFLGAAATAAAIAKLDAAAIAAVMIGAWVLVALIEWAASRADRRRDEIPEIMPLMTVEPAADPAWFVPPVEQTLIETTGETTAVTRLPPAPPDDIDATVDRPVG
jgi:hypothetical protein